MSKGITPIGKKNPNLPFHPAVRAGDFIFVSGQVAKDENGNMCVGNIEEETRWTIESIRRILALDGADLSDVVKVTVFLEDARNFGRYNRVFAEYFPEGMLSPHHGRGARRHRMQDRNGRRRLQAAKTEIVRGQREAAQARQRDEEGDRDAESFWAGTRPATCRR